MPLMYNVHFEHIYYFEHNNQARKVLQLVIETLLNVDF